MTGGPAPQARPFCRKRRQRLRKGRVSAHPRPWPRSSCFCCAVAMLLKIATLQCLECLGWPQSLLPDVATRLSIALPVQAYVTPEQIESQGVCFRVWFFGECGFEGDFAKLAEHGSQTATRERRPPHLLPPRGRCCRERKPCPRVAGPIRGRQSTAAGQRAEPMMTWPFGSAACQHSVLSLLLCA